ncbi:MAG: MarR family transcriptional regulator [Spirochaetales bacterium]|jgi:DNA-binding MarR family transcriptional regulator|nr:MarR family transcriptional regulator [Spirochaetales bacterium]
MDHQEYCDAINKLIQSIGSKFAKASGQQFAGLSLTASQISILLLLDARGASKVSDISSFTNMNSSNVTNICKRLENMGLVRRNRQEDDQRVVKIELTAEAIEKMGGIKATVNNFHLKMRGCVSVADLRDIHTGLIKLNRLFDIFLIMGERG